MMPGCHQRLFPSLSMIEQLCILINVTTTYYWFNPLWRHMASYICVNIVSGPKGQFLGPDSLAKGLFLAKLP